MSTSYGPFTGIVELSGFAMAAANSIVFLIWGKGIEAQIPDAFKRKSLQVIVTIFVFVTLVTLKLYSDNITLEIIYSACIFSFFFGLLSLLFLLKGSGGATSVHGNREVYLYIVAAAFLSSAAALGGSSLERSINNFTPRVAQITVQGSDDQGGEAPAILRGVETEEAVLTLNGKVSWYSSQAEPTGTIRIKWGIKKGDSDISEIFDTVLLPSPSSLEGITRNLIIKILDKERKPGSKIHVYVQIKDCLLNRPLPTKSPAGQPAVCKFTGEVAALPK